MSGLSSDLPFVPAGRMPEPQNVKDGSASSSIHPASYMPEKDFPSGVNTSLNSYTISLFLVSLAFFIHPYILTIIAAVLQLWFKIKPRFFLPVYSISLAIFWGSRTFGVSYIGFYDDAIGYMNQFHIIRGENIAFLVADFIRQPSNYELLYTLFVYTVGIFTSDEIVFAFLIYLVIASLISIAGLLVNQRYYMVMICALFFGIGSFASLDILHLWRSAIASLMFLIAVTYYSKSRQVAYLIMLGACLVHMADVLLILLFLVFQLNKYMKNKYIMLSVIFLLFFIFYYFIQFYGFYLNLLTGKDAIVYFVGSSSVSYTDWIKILILLILFYLLKRNKLDYRSSFMIAGQSIVLLAFITFPGIIFTGRFYEVFIVFTALMLFEVIVSIKNMYLVSSVLIVLFALKFFTMSNSQFMQQAYSNFSNIFSGILFIVNK